MYRALSSLVPNADDLLANAESAPGHGYTQVRMAEPKLPGPSVYLTGYTPFDHTLEFEWG